MSDTQEEIVQGSIIAILKQLEANSLGIVTESPNKIWYEGIVLKKALI